MYLIIILTIEIKINTNKNDIANIIIVLNCRMLILECSPGCCEGRTVALLCPFATLVGEGIMIIKSIFSYK
jgi:hypothetical protein